MNIYYVTTTDSLKVISLDTASALSADSPYTVAMVDMQAGSPAAVFAEGAWTASELAAMLEAGDLAGNILDVAITDDAGVHELLEGINFGGGQETPGLFDQKEQPGTPFGGHGDGDTGHFLDRFNDDQAQSDEFSGLFGNDQDEGAEQGSVVDQLMEGVDTGVTLPGAGMLPGGEAMQAAISTQTQKGANVEISTPWKNMQEKDARDASAAMGDGFIQVITKTFMVKGKSVYQETTYRYSEQDGKDQTVVNEVDGGTKIINRVFRKPETDEEKAAVKKAYDGKYLKIKNPTDFDLRKNSGETDKQIPREDDGTNTGGSVPDDLGKKSDPTYGVGDPEEDEMPDHMKALMVDEPEFKFNLDELIIPPQDQVAISAEEMARVITQAEANSGTGSAVMMPPNPNLDDRGIDPGDLPEEPGHGTQFDAWF